MLRNLGKMLGNEVPDATAPHPAAAIAGIVTQGVEATQNAMLDQLMQSKKNPIVLVMIVKDEAAVIEDTLTRVLPWVDAAVILDTGSSDQTPNICRRVLEAAAKRTEHGLPGGVQIHEWEGYAASRNRVLALGRGIASAAFDPRSTYLLVLDAGESLSVVGPIGELTLDAYKVPLILGGTRFFQFRVFRADMPFEYKGELHEVPSPGRPHTEGRIDNMIIRERQKAAADPLAAIERYTNDAVKFEELVAKDPSDTRSWFYLAQSYRDSLQIDKAIEAYEKRATMGGYDEEVFWSLVEIGRKKDNPLGRPFSEVREALIKAYNFRPWRAEPLYTLGWICRRESLWGEAEMYQRQAASLPFPPNDQLCVEVEIYSWMARYELSIDCYWTGKFAESARLSQWVMQQMTIPENHRNQAVENLRHAILKLAETGQIAAVGQILGGGAGT